MHKVLKRIVDSSIGGFNRLSVRINSAIESQVCKVRASMEMSRIKIPTCYNKMKPNVCIVYSRLFYRVSDRALSKLYVIFQELLSGDFEEECNDFWMRDCLGLPCHHSVGRSLIDAKPITPCEIHRFWKQIEWDRIIRFETDDVVGYSVSMSVTELRCDEG